MDSTHKRLPYLESIELNGLFEMSHVWKCKDRNIFLIPQHQPALQLQLPFQNLTNIVLGDCHRLKYLFSPLMVKYLSNLKSVIIYECDGIEEIISSRDDDANEEENFASSTSSHQISTTSLFFPQLNILELEYLPCLRSLDDACDTIHDQSQVSGEVLIHAFWSSLCQCPRRILLFRCDAISVLIPCRYLQDMFFSKMVSFSYEVSPVVSTSDFTDVIEAFSFPELLYVGGRGRASPIQLIGRVYTTNETPLDKEIPFHHKMPYISVDPSQQYG
ncbi:hypothetical protein E3N88_02056 [Mikania micrantha]|uniref:Disease resistance protein At4g27190-like leucine-rich repeats domain-containing protein n=1 Tax=Mikania micrantha TaxID=192012 RepID=A0A5N6Q5G0_9ASTR|nr:hypothetical protein E3N88_02056 [Mikania micrantha]